MSVKEPEKYPCEFARDCLTEDGETCEKNPEACGKWKKLVVLEETDEEEVGDKK